MHARTHGTALGQNPLLLVVRPSLSGCGMNAHALVPLCVHAYVLSCIYALTRTQRVDDKSSPHRTWTHSAHSEDEDRQS